MNYIRKHIPGFIDGETETASFESEAELLSIDWVRGYMKWPGHQFQEFALCDNQLISVYNKGRFWWTVGYLQETEGLSFRDFKEVKR